MAPLSKAEIENLYLIREYLEALSVRQAMKNVTQMFIRELKDVHEEMIHCAEDEDCSEMIHLENKFHYIILKQTDNPILEKNLRSVIERIERYCNYGFLNIFSHKERIIHEHKYILDAIAHHECDMAERAMREHIVSSYKCLLLNDELQHI